MIIRRWLKINTLSREGDVTVLKTEPALVRGEFAFPLVITVPELPKRLMADKPICVTLPGYTEPSIDTGELSGVEETEIEGEATA